MNLYEIRAILEKQEKSVFTINEISKILKINKKIASIYIVRMRKKGLISKIEKNKICITDDIFITASQLVFTSYISLTTALYLHNIIPQIINKIYIVTAKKRRKSKISESDIVFIQTSKKMMYGYKKIRKGGGFIFLADIEKTIIDCLNFPRYCRLNYVFEAIKKADIKKLCEYLLILNKEVVNRRAGYLMDMAEISHDIKTRKKTIYKLNPTVERGGEFNKKWRLYINEKIK